jgi:cell division septation protein DedD
MRLEAFIAELLFEHDCVIVPNFGGLVATYRPARLNQSAHRIMPPSKHVGFNRNLLHNDGLLTHHVATRLGIAYADAQQRIADLVLGYQRQLTSNGRIHWEKIGVFFHDNSGVLQFIPEEQENFLLEAYGWKPLQLSPVEQLTSSKDEEKGETPVITLKPKRAISAWKVAAVAIPIALAGALLTISQMRNGQRFEMASLNPFDNKELISDYIIPAESKVEDAAVASAHLEQVVAENPDETTVPYNFVEDKVDNSGIEVQLNEAKKELAKSTAEVKPSNSGNWQIIGGAFMFEDNAEKLVEQLRSKGFAAAKAGTQRGLFLVTYGHYASEAEAIAALGKIRKSVNSQAWIRRK